MAILLTKNAEIHVRLDESKNETSAKAENKSKTTSMAVETNTVRHNEAAKLNEHEASPTQSTEPAPAEAGPDRVPSASPDSMLFQQGPTYTGYPASSMNSLPYMPYPIDGFVYPNPIMDYNSVNNQAIFGPMPAAHPYLQQTNNGYYSVFPYQFYPILQYSPAESGIVVPLLPSPEAWGNGYVTGSPDSIPTCEGQTLPLPVLYPPGPMNTSAPTTWSQLPPETKGSVKGNNQSGTTVQQQSQLSASSKSTSTKTSSNKTSGEVKSSALDSSKKQYRRVVAAAMLSKSVWPPQGWHYVPVTQTLKSPLISSCVPTDCNLVDINNLEFPLDYKDAKFFIIKSFSEENVIRSIQHGVWASTPNGNEKLNAAFQDAQKRAAGNPDGCPVFLFFSVNGSGKFCGVAEMTGPVDYKKTMEFWERNKWTGSFPVKWHIVKDLPNSQLRRIILQNNENKPVTSSRDTQEVNFQQGMEMLSVFKNFFSKNSIMDLFPKLATVPKVVPDSKPQQLSSQCPAGECEKLINGVKSLQLSSQPLKSTKTGSTGTRSKR